MLSSARITDFSLRHYKAITAAMILSTLALAALAALPSLWPETFPFLNPIRVDTDPEDMLSAQEPVRAFHREMKKKLGLHDMVVVGVVNDSDPNGVFNPHSLARIYELTEYAKTLTWPDRDNASKQEGVVEVDLIAPSTVDNIEQAGLGAVKFEWLMPEPPTTEAAALAVRAKAEHIPFLRGTLVSEDGKAVCLYLPLTHKDLSYRVYQALNKKIATLTGPERYFITGLPVAEDTFGVEMFVQMAISAPLAMLVIFLLMLYFFRKLALILSPMILALATVVSTMGVLIIAGFPVHIMSSMIPIFLMPIAVLDSVHILSEFFERYQKTQDRRATMIAVMDELFSPMLYTSLTSAAGFASLALTPIPPVQVFGMFVAGGVMLAWVWTVTFIPAYVMFISPKRLADFGAAPTAASDEATAHGALGRFLWWTGDQTRRRAKPILAGTAVLAAVAAYGIGRININDNPTKWFTASHPIRVADRVLNQHFGGTYMAYLALSAEPEPYDSAKFLADLSARAEARVRAVQADKPQAAPVFAEVLAQARILAPQAESRDGVLAALADRAAAALRGARGDQAEAWDEAGLFLDEERQRGELFKDPAVLRYVSRLQAMLAEQAVVGKSNSVADLVKTTYRELLGGEEANYRIPDTRQGVAQCLITYQNSHRAGDVWHFVTPDYRSASLWVQLKSGDNQDMSRVVAAVNAFIAREPPPAALRPDWFGLTYINVIWQDKMVWGMLQSFLGSFLVVFLLMVILFRSVLWGLLSMIPLTVTIAAIYGVIGLVGKDYDMPVAVLSSLTLGLAVDFAIHLLTRAGRLHAQYGTWERAAPAVFGEPARAITRNIIVIAVGFLPLLFAPLVPYRTVGVFMAAILAVSGVGTLIILPALVTVLETRLFRVGPVMGATCNCLTCIVSAVTLVLVVAVNVHQFALVHWTTLTWISAAAVPVLALGCGLISRREKCRIQPAAGSAGPTKEEPNHE